MKSIWLNKRDNKDLLIFFNGWGLDENPFLFLDPSGFDIIMFYDYTKIEGFDFSFIQEYNNSYILSFSFGVAVASILHKNGFFKKKFVSINGTPFMISERYGIKPTIFNLTLSSLNKNTIIDFYKNMFLVDSDFNRFLENLPKREIDDQKNELLKLSSIEFDYTESIEKSLISSRDKIVFSLNQKRFCNDYGINFKVIDSGHFPFYNWNSWGSILEEIYG